MNGCDTIDEGETVTRNDPITGSEVEIETGLGWNPETGRVERYNEIWR